MHYEERLPRPALRSLVACFWRISGARGEHRVLPDGAIDIVVIDGVARVVGTMTQAVIVPPTSGEIFGVRFRAGEAVRVLAAACELTDADAPLEDIWGDAARRIQDGRTTLEAEVIARLTTRGEATDVRVRAAASVLASGGSVCAAASRACLSERQLSRRFASRVGVAPKLFSRVMRLQRAAGALSRGASALEASLTAGYADQAHFTRESRELALVTPAMLASEMFKTPVAFAG